MAKEPLSTEDIAKLNALVRQLFRLIADFKSTNKLAEKIKYPQIPSALTESLAIDLLTNNNIIPQLPGFDFKFGGKVADVIAVKGNQEVKIEIKATAKSAFQYFGEKDISADYIIWIHFGNYYLDSSVKKIEVCVIPDPAQYFGKPLKVTLTKLKQIAESGLKNIFVSIN